MKTLEKCVIVRAAKGGSGVLSARAGVIHRDLRVNQRIRAKEVRVIGEAGQNLGVMALPQALATAKERDLDLVEVDPHGLPPVCRLLDYGKWKYAQSKKDRDARKHQRGLMVHEVRMRPHISDHDMERKVRLAERLLGQGDKVKVTVMFRGREMAHPETGRALLDRVLGQLQQCAVVDSPPNMQGRFLSTILAPTNKRPPKVAKKDEEERVGQT